MNHLTRTLHTTALLFLSLALPAAAQGTATLAKNIKLPEGFQIELLYSVPQDQHGSWVAICQDDKNRFIVSDQYGSLYRFPIPAAGKLLDPSTIEKIDLEIGHAQGLCYAFDSLYVVVNSRSSKTGSGVFRVLDTNKDDKFDKVVTIKKLAATGGEHGPHAIMLTPDRKNLIVVMGNQTQLPPDYSHSRVPELWGEDELLPRSAHFMKGVEAPLGHIAQIDPEGKTWEILATGFRNQYDAAYNWKGELFTYDADMEWDLNTPWYRPTRVNHVIDGAEFGWRTGSAKFPEHYSDSFGAVVNIGPGSPTGVAFGYGAKFPAKYQHAFYICDWSYGKLYAVHMEEAGSTYTATFEEFASAAPLPLTDILVNPNDGAMYFAVGGRRVQSGLYRVTYTGKESTARADKQSPGTIHVPRAKRRMLEAHLRKGAPLAEKRALEVIWDSLGAGDRGIRHAARVALEKQPVKGWKSRALAEVNPRIATAALIALARADGKNSAAEVSGRAISFDYAGLKQKQDRLDLLRVLTLALTRGGEPTPGAKRKLIAYLDKIYPATSPEENRELSVMMAYLHAPSAVSKGMALLEKASGQEEQITCAMNLRFLKEGWTPELRAKYFQWFVRAGNYQGGARFKNYLGDFKKDAVKSIPANEKTKALTRIINTQPAGGPQFSTEARTFVKMWKMADLQGLLGAGLEGGRNFANGRKMFGAGTCYVCHRFNNEGGAVGPDLTSVSGKFSPHDLLESIIDPGKEISDQYGASVFKLANGTQVIGRIMNLKGDTYRVTTDMMKPSTTTTLKVSTIKSIEPSPISMMPPGLLSTMKDDDILDLLAYLLSAGNPNHELYKN
jgi:putative heme-binding domain-containing protein